MSEKKSSTNELRRAFGQSRQASVPLLAVTTADPEITIASVRSWVKEDEDDKAPIMSWRPGRGLKPENKAGVSCLRDLLEIKNKDAELKDILDASSNMTAVFNDMNSILAMKAGASYMEYAVVLVENFHRFLEGANPVINIQSIFNLRSEFKQTGATWIGLCPGVTLPPELSNDIIILDHPLPNREELTNILTSAYNSADVLLPDEKRLTQEVDAITGLAQFPAEQVCFMSITPSGMDIEDLWRRKAKQVEQTPGLKFLSRTSTFDDVRGLENWKTFHSGVLSSSYGPNVVVVIDEIEKAINSSIADNTGVSQDITAEILKFMETRDGRQVLGVLNLGHPGGGKTLIAKAAAATFGIPALELDLGGMKNSLVGSSEQRVRQALKVIEAVGNGNILFIATCNKFSGLSPEIRRRFNFAQFFFDLPTQDERDGIWDLYIKKFKLEGQELPDSTDWTGAEIFNTCLRSQITGMSLVQSAKFFVPSHISAAQAIADLRQEADGAFISASYDGPYRKGQPAETTVVSFDGGSERKYNTRRTKITG